MKTLKKIVRKLYHLIWFLSLFILFFIPNVNASSVNVSYPSLVTSASNLSSGIQCNSSFCVNYNVPVRFDMNFVTMWTANTSKTCNTQTSISGHINVQGSGELSITPDWYADNLLRVVVGANNVDYTCTYNTPSGGHIYYTCLLPSLPSSFNVAYVFKERTISSAYTNTTSIAYRELEINCSSDSNENITYSTDRIINSQNNNTDRIINDNRRENNETREKIEENTDAINGLDDTLNDSSVDSSDSTINNLKSKIPTNSVISDLLLLPVRFLQNFVNALGSSCSQFNLGSLYGTNLYMPCINIESYLGSAIWTTIDLIISGLFVYKLRKKFIEIYQNLTNLKNGGNEVD